MARGFRALMIWFLSLWHGVSQKQLATRSGIPDKRVSYLLGRPEIDDGEHEKLLAATHSNPAEVQVVTACLDGLRSVEANTALIQEELEQVERGVREGARLLRDLLTDLTLGSRWEPVFDGYPRPADVEPARFHAWRLWETLEIMTEEEQLEVVRLNEDHHSWALMERVCEASIEQASRDAGRAASLARVAQAIAERVQGPEGWQKAVQGYAAAHLPNALRVAGELRDARARFEEAKRLWSAGDDPDRVLDPGRLLDLEASLCRDERQFEKALALLDEALLVSRHPPRILVNKASILEVMGEYPRAIVVLLRAEPLLDRSAAPRLRYKHKANLAVNYCHTGDYAKASGLIEEARIVAMELGDDLDLLRLLWVSGQVAAGLGHREEAHQSLAQAAQQFEAKEMWYDVALAQLEIAVLLLEEGRAGEVHTLARELVQIFDSKRIHREALAALRLFHEAAQRDEATADLARSVLTFLFRARHDQSLEFAARQLAIRVEHGSCIGLESVGVEHGSLFGRGEAAGVENGSFIGRGESIGVEHSACVDKRVAPDGRKEGPEPIPEERLAGGRSEQRTGEDNGNERWAHRKVSCVAPASDHRGPRGPRLPDILRQVAKKNPGLRPVDSGMTWKNLLVRLVRALVGQTQERFSETTQVELRMLDHYEQGKRQPGTETLERVTRQGYGLEVHEAEEILRFAETLRRPRQRPARAVEVVLDDLASLVSRVYQRLLRMPLETAVPAPEDPQCIETLWFFLKDLPENQ